MTSVAPALAAALQDRYRLDRELGQGGMATVYLAHDLKHDRDVALKVLRPEVADVLGAERFLREIRIAANLSHPHILTLHDSGTVPLPPGSGPASLLYYVMPWVEGGSLRNRLSRQRQLPLDEVLRITREVAGALECAHRHGIIHRDIKPENILFHEGHAALADFGIARLLRPAASESSTEAGFLLGTPEYMSPEACAGDESVGVESDQYSLACVVYEMLAGQPPFVAAMPRAVVARHLADRVPPLTIVRPDLPEPVAEAVTRALAKVPGDRFPSVMAFAEALESATVAHRGTAARAVAVLPFSNLGGLPEDEALSDGITDEIIAVLSRVEGLRVASRTSVYACKGRREDVRTLAGQLHVGSVLEGSVRRLGGRIRVAVQLVSAEDGYTLWSERFDRELSDVFAIQDEIANQVARALRVILRGAGAEAGRRVPTADVRAYEYYLRGRQYFRHMRRKSLHFAREMFQRAASSDPAFALAWAGTAEACSLLDMYYPGAAENDLGLADLASARALELAPELPEAHAARGFALWRLKRENEALAAFETAMRLDPKQFEARYFAARLCFQRGETARAAELFEDAARADEDYQARFFAAQSYEALGRKAEAEAAYRRALHVVEQHLEMNPDDPRAATMRAVSLCRLGRQEEGLEWAERARRIDPEDPGVLYNVACLYALQGMTDRAIDCLEETMRAGFGDMAWIAHDPDLASLKDEPRFQAIMSRT